MPATLSPYVEFRSAALDAGIDRETVSILSDGYRDSHEHGWTGQALEWCHDPEQLIEWALEDPEKIAAVCSYFFYSDGGNHVEGLNDLDERSRAIAEHLLAEGWDAELRGDLPPPRIVVVPTQPATDSEIMKLMTAAVLKKYPAMEVELSKFATHSTDYGSRTFYANVTVNDPAIPAYTTRNISRGVVSGYEGAGFHIGEFEYLVSWDMKAWKEKMWPTKP